MKMPIVSLNNMAMNESVAATCCYKEEMINGYHYESALNGGTVEDVLSTEQVWVVDESWKAEKGDYNVPGIAGLVYFNGKPGYVTTAGAFVALTAEDLVAGSEYCDHQYSNCLYWETGAPVYTSTHIGSTVKHTAGGDKWAENHAAVRFNS